MRPVRTVKVQQTVGYTWRCLICDKVGIMLTQIGAEEHGKKHNQDEHKDRK